MTPPEPSRSAVAAGYRAQRTRELKLEAEKAVGGPVVVAASFYSSGSWSIVTKPLQLLIPVIGWYFLVRDWIAKRGLEGVRLLAIDEERLYAVGSQATESEALPEPEVVRSWYLAEVHFIGTRRSGPDHRISFRARGRRRTYRFYCSSLTTNPWASELVRRLGGFPPEPLDATRAPIGL